MRVEGEEDIGGRPGFESFYAAEFGGVAAALRLLCAEPASAEDLAQEAMYRALLHWRRVVQMDSPGGWLYTVAVNLARRQARRHHTPIAPQPGSVDVSEQVARRSDLTAAIRRLPYDQRAALVVRHVLGYSTNETAVVLERSPDATRAMLHRAVSALRADRVLSAHDDVEKPTP